MNKINTAPQPIPLAYMVPCPRCFGRKASEAFVQRSDESCNLEVMECSFCSGVGQVTTLQDVKFEMGRKLAQMRTAKRYAIRELTRTCEWSLSDWSDFEHGRSSISNVDAAMRWLDTLPEREAKERNND